MMQQKTCYNIERYAQHGQTDALQPRLKRSRKPHLLSVQVHTGRRPKRSTGNRYAAVATAHNELRGHVMPSATDMAKTRSGRAAVKPRTVSNLSSKLT